MDEHLSKPVDIAVLERAVRKYLVTPEKWCTSTIKMNSFYISP